MPNEKEEQTRDSRRVNITLLLAQTLGLQTMLFLPFIGVSAGAVGHVIVYALIYIVIGIPVMYMENVVGQFTGRDCIEVWKARPCLAHFGYVHIIWQVLHLVYLFALGSFVVHYFLISFENPIPYYICGNWSTADCNILIVNYTVNQECVRAKETMPYCSELCTTFPEVQYWRYNILGMTRKGFHLPWRVCLASGLLASLLFLSCFKGRLSLKWALLIVTILPTSGRILFFIGSMFQKGIVVKFEEAFDTDFNKFIQRFSLSTSIADVLYTLNVGTGLSFACASRTTFRAACYSNTVIVVVITCCVSVLGICGTVMMICPYAYKYDIDPVRVMNYPISHIFEKVPRFLYVYEQTSFWLIISYSYIAISAFTLNICIISSLIEMVSKRYSMVARNPGLTAFVIAITMYLATVPLLGNLSLYFLVDAKRTMNLVSIFLVICENFVFVLWYGLERFSEDVHFMQGVQPKSSVKACWLVSGFILVYVLVTQLYKIYVDKNHTTGNKYACYFLIINICVTVLVTIVKLVIALYKKNLYEQLSLDSEWGPKSEILRRSRAMFSAQAMTKEYMYRQYHLQAGILKRQQRSNVRVKQPGVRFDVEKK
uniref:SFRICE_041129 n=1 Tax=Spodoptera frugiperda TaxID=7108 RepID=A0A2H1V6P3_SPOFR